MMVIEQYDIVLVNLDPTMGSEIKKTRPCLVISPNEMNHHLRTIVVAPMTSSVKAYPSRITIIHNGKTGAAALDQIRTVDKIRVVRVLGRISREEIEQCKSVLREIFIE